MESFAPTARTEVRRYPGRAVYDKARIDAILDEGRFCHVGFAVDGQPFVVPTSYARSGDRLFLHGSAASRMLRTLQGGVNVCVTVTLIDGLVLARSAFHHSVNYRPVMVIGTARPVDDAAGKLEALRAFTNHMVPGRWDEIRPPTSQELKATMVLLLPLEEVSAKVRSGPPIDDDQDYSLPVWAGVVPLRTAIGDPVDDGRVPSGVAPFDTQRFSK